MNITVLMAIKAINRLIVNRADKVGFDRDKGLPLFFMFSQFVKGAATCRFKT